MEESISARFSGFLYGLIFAVSFGYLVNLLEVFINVLLLVLPIVAAYFFPKWFPTNYRQANRFSYIGIMTGAIIDAAIILQTTTGFAAIAAILIIPLAIIYILVYAIVISLLHHLLIQPEDVSPPSRE